MWILVKKAEEILETLLRKHGNIEQTENKLVAQNYAY